MWDFSSDSWSVIHAAVMARGNDGYADMNETVDGLTVFTTGSNIRAGGEAPNRYFQPNGAGRVPDRRLFFFTAQGSGTLKVTSSNTSDGADETRMVNVQIGEDTTTLQSKSGGAPSSAPVTNTFEVNASAGQTVYVFPGAGLRFYRIEWVM
jgi:hypothetical protein